MKIIARIRNAYDGKFGVPRQSGLVEEVISTIVFEPEYRVAEALRGIEEFSHLWLIWAFDRAEREGWSPTVRPPRLGGNQRIGVFATRSPYRPNAIGLIKPYLPYADCRPEATGGFTDRTAKRTVQVYIPDEVAGEMNPEDREALKAVLREDPRPAYQDDPERIYAFEFGGKHVEFRVEKDLLIVTKLC